MRRRFLRFLATFTFRRAWLLLPLVAALTGGAWWMAVQGQIDTSLIAFLPPAALQHQTIGEIVSDYRRLEPLMVLVRARRPDSEAEQIGVTREMARWLNDPRYFTSIVYTTDELAQSYYESLSDIRLIELLTPDDWAELERLMSERISADRLRKLMVLRQNAFIPPKLANASREDPLGALAAIRNRLASSRGPTRLETRNGYLLGPDGKAMAILLYPALAPENGRNAVRTWNFLQETQDALLERHPSWRGAFEFEFEGSMIDTARLIERVKHEQKRNLALALPLVALLFLLVFRKVEAILFILLPPLVGLVWTLGLATWIFQVISSVAAAFLLVILVMGLQYNVHLYHRFILELYRGHNYYRALSQSYVETGRGVLASAAVVALLFFSLLVTSLHGGWGGGLTMLRDASGFGQLGLVAGMGILCNLAACLLSLPLLASIKHLMARGRIKPVMLYRFGLERLYEPAVANPRATLGVMLLLCVFFGYHARRLDFYPRFASVTSFFFHTAPEGSGQTGSPGAAPTRPGRPIVAVVHGKTLQEALERNDRLYENLRALGGKFNILSYDSLRTVLPSLKSQQESLERMRKLDLTPLRQSIDRVSREVGFKPIVYEPFLKALEKFKQNAAQAEPIEYGAGASEALIAAAQRAITRKEDGYYIATTIYPHAGGFIPSGLRALEAALRSGIDRLDLIGDPLIERELARTIKFNLAVMILLSILIIFLALILHYRGQRLAWLTFLPVLAELVWLCGLMSQAGLQIHFFTVLGMPLALSLAVDNALQITQYYYDRRPCTVRHTMASLGRVTMLTCGMTGLLFGTMVLSSYPGLRDFGAVVLLSSLAVLAGTVMLLPALLQLFGRGQPVLGALAEEGEEEL